MASNPGPSTSKHSPNTSRQDIRKQSKEIIQKVYTYLKKIEDPQKLLEELQRPQDLTAHLCGVSLATVKRITATTTQDDFESPRKKYKRLPSVTSLDEFDQDLVRREIFNFYNKGEYPTLKKLKEDLKEKINFEGSITSLYRILKDIGFKFGKLKSGRKALMEKSDIVVARLRFLRKMHSLRASGDDRPVFYLDETWINQNHSRSHGWQDASGSGGLKVPEGKGGRLIILHVGSAKTGFIPESKLIFRANVKSFDVDYHGQMDAGNFTKWFTDSFINFLEEPSIIVMDNAPYHSVQIRQGPTSQATKKEIIEWLREKNIDFPPGLTKLELYEIVKRHKPQEKLYEIDEIALERGHEVVRLPPYHCQYNPIELIWAQVKGEVAEKNNTFKIADVERLTHEAISHVTIDNWRNCVRHAETLQEDDFKKEIVRDDMIDPIIIHLGEDDNTSEWDTDSD